MNQAGSARRLSSLLPHACSSNLFSSHHAPGSPEAEDLSHKPSPEPPTGTGRPRAPRNGPVIADRTFPSVSHASRRRAALSSGSTQQIGSGEGGRGGGSLTAASSPAPAGLCLCQGQLQQSRRCGWT